MDTDLERALARELDDVADRLVVPPLPALPAAPPRTARWRGVQPLLVAAVVLVTVMATVGGLLSLGGEDRGEPAPAPDVTTTAEDDAPLSRAVPDTPFVVGVTLYVGGEKVSGQWYSVQGTATGWVGLRVDGTWWSGKGTRPQRIEGTIDQSVTTSPAGGYEAYVADEGSGPTLMGADTEPGGADFGGLPVEDSDPAPFVPAVTDDGLVVVRGADYQRLWRPLVDGESVDLAQTAPGQVVIGNTRAGLIVNEGAYNAVDGTQGAPYLARLDQDGTLTKIGSVPTHDALEASAEWVAYVPPGTVGGEASGTAELQVRRLAGGASEVLTAPDGYLFVAPGFRWESADRLLVTLVTLDGGDEALARCRPQPASCVLVPVT